MALNPKPPFPKAAGNPIRADDWNDVVKEVQRLDGAKLDLAGGSLSGQLTMQQNATVQGTLSVKGSSSFDGQAVFDQLSAPKGLNVADGGTLSSAGRLHISGTELLFLLNTSGVVVGKEWGGNGSLVVEGLLMPSVGNTAENGIRFPTDPGGGSGDEAFIRYFVEAEENTVLAIGCNNDAQDRISFVQQGAERMKVANAGVQIQGRLEVNGQSCAVSFCNLSDARLKADVAAISDPLDRLGQVRGVSFRWQPGPHTGETGSAEPDLVGRDGTGSLGVVAQEVAEVFPELVSTIGEQEHLGVDYAGLTAVLVEAVKQLKAENDDLRQRVLALEAG